MTGITPAAMRSGYMSGKWESFTAAIDELAQRPIYLSDRTDWNTVTFRAECARLKREYGIGWVMLDYLELLKDTYGKDANERGAFISDALHGVFKDLQLAGLVIDSMNKEGIASVTPAQHHVGGAARKIYNADAIVFISRNRQNKEIIDLTWGKNREGESDLTAQLYKPEGSLKFSEVTYAKEYPNHTV
jgi:replicative DNA helicase